MGRFRTCGMRMAVLVVLVALVAQSLCSDSLITHKAEPSNFKKGFLAGLQWAASSPPAEHMKWDGAFNSTHGSENGSLNVCQNACETGNVTCIRENSSRAGEKGTATCDACAKADAVFVSMRFRSKQGRCAPISTQAKFHCIPTNGKTFNALKLNAKDMLCTKWRLAQTAYKLGEEIKEERELLKALKVDDETLFRSENNNESNEHVVGDCRFWKQVLCQGNKCMVRKEVKCLNVCRLDMRRKRHHDTRVRAKHGNHRFLKMEKKINGKYPVVKGSCDPSLCERYGTQICRLAAIVE